MVIVMVVVVVMLTTTTTMLLLTAIIVTGHGAHWRPHLDMLNGHCHPWRHAQLWLPRRHLRLLRGY